MENQKEYKKYQLNNESSWEIETELLDLREFFAEGSDAPFEGHTHEYYQIIWFRRGEGVHFVDFKEYEVRENTLFFISPGQVHHFDRNTDFDGVMIHFNENFLSDENSSENIFLKYNVFNAFDAAPCYTIAGDEPERLNHLVKEMQYELRHTEAFAAHDYLKYLIKMFLISIQRHATRGTGQALCINNAANRTFVKFRQLLEHHYCEVHTVKEYADRMNISSKNLTNCVVESARSTPLKMINERITLEAKRQLLYSSLKIKEIGYLLGFDDPSYFIKFFKRQTGSLPAEFRQ